MKKLENILNYSQPDFYRFSRDSIELAIVASELEQSRSGLRILEVFAGSGVISIEFESRLKAANHITFNEIQVKFKEHLEFNSKNLSCNYEIIIDHFKNIKSKERYDIIFANPPYFKPQSKRLGVNDERNLCRFSLNFDLQELLTKFEELLATDGVAYISHRDPLEKVDSRIERVGNYESVGLFRFNLNKNRA